MLPHVVFTGERSNSADSRGGFTSVRGRLLVCLLCGGLEASEHPEAEETASEKDRDSGNADESELPANGEGDNAASNQRGGDQENSA